jgi:hemerythrin-like domain-containing protein
MNTTAFRIALDTVEKDHEMVVSKVRALKDAVNAVIDGEAGNPRQLLGRFRKIYSFFNKQFEAHMEEEEHTLFPFLQEDLPGGPDLVAQLRTEHAEIRTKRKEFGDCLEVAGQLEENLPDMVVLDLVTYAWRLWELLDNHAHRETRAVEQCLMQSLASIQSAVGSKQ